MHLSRDRQPAAPLHWRYEIALPRAQRHGIELHPLDCYRYPDLKVVEASELRHGAARKLISVRNHYRWYELR